MKVTLKRVLVLLCVFTCLTCVFASCEYFPSEFFHKCEYVEHKAVQATCTEKGTDLYYTCSGCDKMYDKNMEEISQIPEIPALAHKASATWESDGQNHWHKCERCGVVMDETKQVHSGGTATCQAKAVCSVCSKDYGEISEHDFTKQVTTDTYLVSPATCTSKAVYYYSCACGQKGEETFEHGDVLGHDMSTEWSKDGEYHWHVCTREGCDHIEDKAEHSGGTASCISMKECAICGGEYGTLGHTGELLLAVTTQPNKTSYTAFETFDADGMVVSSKCTNCDGTAVTDYTIVYQNGNCFHVGDSKVFIKYGDMQAEVTVTVSAKEVAVIWSNEESYTYNGQEFAMPIAKYLDVDGQEVALTVNCDGTFKCAGTYTFTASFANGETDYAIGEGETKQLTVAQASQNAISGLAFDGEAVCMMQIPAFNGVSATFGEVVIGYAVSQGTTAKEDLSYVSYDVANGSFADGLPAGTYYVKAEVYVTSDYVGAVEYIELTVEHVNGELKFSDMQHWYVCENCKETLTKTAHDWEIAENEGVETISCKVCELESYTFNVKYTGSHREYVLTNESFALTLDGVSEYQEVKSISVGEISLGTDISALDMTALIATPQSHGEQNIAVVVVDSHGCEHTVIVPALFVTREFAQKDVVDNSFYDALAYNGEAIFGYYRLSETIYPQFKNTGSSSSTWLADKGFRGTFDFNNKTIAAWSSGNGLFKLIGSGAVIKNAKLKLANADGYNRGVGQILSAGMFNATLENIEFIVPKGVATEPLDAVGWSGLISSTYCKNMTFKNITISAQGVIIDSLFGGDGNSAVSGFEADTCMFENFVVNCDQLGALGLAKGLVPVKTAPGVTLNGSKIDYTATEEIMDTDANVTLDLSYFGEIEIKSLKCGDTTISEFTFEDGELSFVNVLGAKGDKVLVAQVVIDGWNHELDIALTVSTNAIEVTLEGVQEFDLSASTSVALDLGEYASCTIEQISLGAYDLGKDASSADLSGVASKPELHGETTIVVNATNDSDSYIINVPVLLVTKTISNNAELKAALKPSGDAKAIYGYYKLTADFNLNGDPDWGGFYNSTENYSWVEAEQGFRGTFDGANHTLTGKVHAKGLFSVIGKGAVIKNVKFVTTEFTGSAHGILGIGCWYATIENVEFEIHPSATQDIPADKGLIVCEGTNYTKFKNVTVKVYDKDGNLADAGMLLGKPTNMFEANTFQNFVILANSLTYIGGKVAPSSASGVIMCKVVSIPVQDFDMSTLEGDTVTVSLGDYAGYTVDSVKFGTVDNGTSLSLDVSAIKNDVTKHGVHEVIVNVHNDTEMYIISAPVCFVTRYISNITDFRTYVLASKWKTANHVDGYFKQTADIKDVEFGCYETGIGFGIWDDVSGKGFCGTYDGGNHQITGWAGCRGLFGYVGGGTIENLTIVCSTYTAATNNGYAILAGAINGMIMENVTIVYKGDDKTELLQGTGLLCDNHAHNVTFKNFTLDATGKKLAGLLGANNGADGSIVFVNSTIKAVDVLAIAHNGGTKYAYQDITNINGLTFVEG